MKTAVALSGCDLGGMGAYYVLERLAQMGVRIDLLSVCCVPALTGLLWSGGYSPELAEKKSVQFLEDSAELDVDTALARFCEKLHFGQAEFRAPTAVNAVNVPDGKCVVFTNGFSIDSQNLVTFELNDAYDACSATVSLMDGLASYHYGGCRLCDYCVWYGAPFRSLRLMGADRILSVSFEPKYPRTPYEVLVKQMLRQTGPGAELHIPIEFAAGPQKLEEYREICEAALKQHSKKIFWRIQL